MPAWWKGKLKSKSKSTASPRTREPETPGTPRAAATVLPDEELVAGAGHGTKEKANSFDEVLGSRKSGDVSLVGGGGLGAGTGFVFGHPLPVPTSISSYGVSTASASSVSSSSSSEETPDLGLYRYSDPINTPRGRNGVRDPQRHEHAAEDRQLFSCSPVLEQPHGGNAYSRGQNSTETIYSRRTASPSPGLTGHHPFPTSPVHPSSFGLCSASPNRRQDNLRSSPQPLPLPPSSPTCSSASPSSCSSSSSSSRSPKSQWKKGKLLGRGTFGHEIVLLSQLSHPNIVQYYGSELAEDTLSVYLEYVSGGSIHKLLQEYGPFGESLTRNYTAQILSGLAYLHGRKTVHRDIKGANILVDPNGEIKLADFGMAKHISAYTSIRSFKGSPYWMAPEVIMNCSGYDLSVDIWSLGCTIIEMATSKPPWSQFEGVAAIFKIGNSKDVPELPDHFSPVGKDFLKLCLQRDPSARPSAAQLMDHPFVRDQTIIKAAKLNMMKDMPQSTSDASHAVSTVEFSSNQSTSPLHDRDCGTRRASGLRSTFPLASKNPSEMPSTRMNMSLPVSPCSSPLRQFKQSNRSCLPSPPHPTYSSGATNHSPVNLALHSTRPCSNLPDPWFDITLFKTQSQYDSPRRLSMGL
ncbi:hypothetical protein MUK42_06608 [Musa troglodytarum]|uniref:Protein kinase domain-containing protein n=1 Tax=Musa troglodytarum TaxID=320322 RepID=A0A9E7KTB9_9LILI|nr:hypothetical protein MUK42_06608 [Musa troglodytarum]